MHQVTEILSAIEEGDLHAAERLFPLVYKELRRLAAEKMAKEKPGQTLQATALVHEAFVRMVDVEKTRHWNSREHFFRAAAEAMRRILVNAARRKGSLKRGASFSRVELGGDLISDQSAPEDLVAVSEALDSLAEHDSQKAELVKLLFFAGLPVQEAATALGISRTTAERHWAYARTWLYCKLHRGEGN